MPPPARPTSALSSAACGPSGASRCGPSPRHPGCRRPSSEPSSEATRTSRSDACRSSRRRSTMTSPPSSAIRSASRRPASSSRRARARGRRSGVLGLSHPRLAARTARRVVRAPHGVRRLDHPRRHRCRLRRAGRPRARRRRRGVRARQGECVVWPSSHPHTMRNDSDAAGVVVGFATEIVH